MSYDTNDISDSGTEPNQRAYEDFLKNIDVSMPEKKQKKKIPSIMPDDDSSDSYESFSRKESKKSSKKHKSNKSETDENTTFTTSQNNVDYSKLDKHVPMISDDDDESEKIYRRPPPSSVAFQLRSSSDDDDDEAALKPKSKPKMTFHRRPAESVAPTKKAKLEPLDDSVSQRNSRPPARSFAPSASSSKSSKSSKSRKWTSDMVNENQLDIQLQQLIDTESRISQAEYEKMIKDDDFFIGDNFSKSGSQSRKKREQDQAQILEDDDSLKEETQTIAEKYYAKMLKKNFPQLVKKKKNFDKWEKDKFTYGFNDKIINWPRERIAEENENIQNEIDQIKKEIKRLNKENEELKKEKDSYY